MIDGNHRRLSRLQQPHITSRETCCTINVRIHAIPDRLVINSDQTAIHLVPMGGDKTWEVKGVKDVHVIGAKDKRQIKVTVTSAAMALSCRFSWCFKVLNTTGLCQRGQTRKRH
jgi:hypothetical protein